VTHCEPQPQQAPGRSGPTPLQNEAIESTFDAIAALHATGSDEDSTVSKAELVEAHGGDCESTTHALRPEYDQFMHILPLITVGIPDAICQGISSCMIR